MWWLLTWFWWCPQTADDGNAAWGSDTPTLTNRHHHRVTHLLRRGSLLLQHAPSPLLSLSLSPPPPSTSSLPSRLLLPENLPLRSTWLQSSPRPASQTNTSCTRSSESKRPPPPPQLLPTCLLLLRSVCACACVRVSLLCRCHCARFTSVLTGERLSENNEGWMRVRVGATEPCVLDVNAWKIKVRVAA